MRPATGDAFALVIPHVSTAAMSVFPAEFAATIAPGRQVVMVLDQAGRHGAKALVVPDTITLVPLPPYCPDLNPVERIRLYLRERFLSHRLPEVPMHLDALLADQPLTGGLEPRLGGSHLRILTIVGFPTATTPGLLDDMNRLPFPYRWSTRAILLDKTDATRRDCSPRSAASGSPSARASPRS